MKCVTSLPLIILLLSLSLTACVSDSRKGISGVVIHDPQKTTTPTTKKSIITRPDQAISFISKCGCKGNQLFSLDDCASFCAGLSPTGQDKYLYVTTGLDASIELTQFQDLKGWCTNQIDNGKESGTPECRIEFRDGVEVINRDIEFTGKNQFKVNLTTINTDKTYLVRLVQKSANVYSRTSQIRLHDPSSNPPGSFVPLSTIPIAQYACVNRVAITDSSNNLYYNAAMRIHFFYPKDIRVPPISSTASLNLYCHDAYTHRLPDIIEYPRLAEIPRAFTLWNQYDNRFTYKNGKLNINTIIQERLKKEHNIDSTQDYFVPYKLVYHPETIPTADPNNTTNSNVILGGYYLLPLLNTTTGKTICPNENDYKNTDIPLFRILKDYIGGDTEALYKAHGEPQSYTYIDPATNKPVTATLPIDVIFIPESVVSKIWFYISENGLKIQPVTEQELANKPMMFYWPPDPDAWDTRKDYQRAYYIQGPNTSEERTVDIAADKRFACVPKSE